MEPDIKAVLAELYPRPALPLAIWFAFFAGPLVVVWGVVLFGRL